MPHIIFLKKNKNYVKEKQLKFLFNVPYKSTFNVIEMCFHLIKNIIYKEIFNKMKNMEKRVHLLVDDTEINNNIKKIYLKELEIYKTFYINNTEKINLIYDDKKFLSKKTKKKRK